MPAKRSRTAGWRRCITELQQRNGAIEIAIARHFDEDEEGAHGNHVMWRVRLLDVGDDELIVEMPSTMGQTVPLNEGIEVVAIFAVGQNRWMFRTTTLGVQAYQMNHMHTLPAVRLVLPEEVERCQRRNYYRIETSALNLPKVDIWPLLDPRSVVLAERAIQLAFERLLESDLDVEPEAHASANSTLRFSEELMPEVGPRFQALLMNVGGGGMGLRVESAQSGPLSRHKLFWVSFALPPEMPHPICASVKLTHTHIDSSHQTYAGVAFDFSFNQAHQRFVVDQICRYVAEQQRLQLKRLAG